MSRRPWFWLLLATPLLGFWLYGLTDLDEGFYATVIAEMNRRSDWLTPTFNGVPWFEKPILMYWLAKPSLMLFGGEFGLRLPSALCALLAYGLCLGFGRRTLGERAAALGTLVVGTSLLMVGVGRFLLADMPLLAALCGALFSYYFALYGRPALLCVTGICLGLGVLAKGPVALALFFGVAISYAFVEPAGRRGLRTIYWLPGVLLLGLTVSAWYLPAYLQNGPQFVDKFLIEQNWNRFLGGDRAHALGGINGLVFYPAVVFLGMFPWSLWLFGRQTWRAAADQDQRTVKFLVCWFVVVFVFFAASQSKLPHYILPALPPLALLVGRRLASTEPGSRLGWRIAAIVAPAVCVLATAGVWMYWLKEHEEVQRLAQFVRRRGGPLVIYQMVRPGGSRTGGLQLRETSHPSVLFYLGATAVQTDSLPAALAQRRPFWLLTRQGRLQPGDLLSAEEAGVRLQPAPVDLDRFRLYLASDVER